MKEVSLFIPWHSHAFEFFWGGAQGGGNNFLMARRGMQRWPAKQMHSFIMPYAMEVQKLCTLLASNDRTESGRFSSRQNSPHSSLVIHRSGSISLASSHGPNWDPLPGLTKTRCDLRCGQPGGQLETKRRIPGIKFWYWFPGLKRNLRLKLAAISLDQGTPATLVTMICGGEG